MHITKILFVHTNNCYKGPSVKLLHIKLHRLMKRTRSGYLTRLHPAPEEQGDTIQPLPVKRSTTATARQCRESTGLSTRRTDSPVVRRVYCNMEDTRCGVRGGWMRVAHINMTDPGETCPSPLRTYTSPRRMCAR